MPDTSVTDEAAAWHKRCAMSCNNRAWDLAAMSRTAAQEREMLDVAHAAHAAGDTNEHRASYGLAVQALDAIADADDRAIVARTFEQVPPPDR